MKLLVKYKFLLGHEEGVLIDNFLMVEDGILREKATLALLASGEYPCRNPDQNMADLEAQVAANNTGPARAAKADMLRVPPSTPSGPSPSRRRAAGPSGRS